MDIMITYDSSSISFTDLKSNITKELNDPYYDINRFYQFP